MNCCDAQASRDQLLDERFRRVLIIALVVNAAMFVVETFASRVGDSMSLQADALDFFSDAANYAISLFVLARSLQARARASMIKGLSMAVFGVWVIASALYRVFEGSSPEPVTMSAIAVLALAANLGVAALLFRHRGGDSNRESVWLCSRNDAIGNVAVVFAAGGVYVTQAHWPDLVVAFVIAGLFLVSALRVVRLAREELRSGNPSSFARSEIGTAS